MSYPNNFNIILANMLGLDPDKVAEFDLHCHGEGADLIVAHIVDPDEADIEDGLLRMEHYTVELIPKGNGTH